MGAILLLGAIVASVLGVGLSDDYERKFRCPACGQRFAAPPPKKVDVVSLLVNLWPNHGCHSCGIKVGTPRSLAHPVPARV
jgi:hypothetical protein